jgi:protein-L-isoaspartate(D-aspartate) O-methyltransferase
MRSAIETRALPTLLRECAEPIEAIESADLGALLDRIRGATVVLIGEASHGTSEFYRMRARITQALIREAGFTLVAIEADWPDASRVDRYVRHLPPRPEAEAAFTRFPTWMWRNQETAQFADWLYDHNRGLAPPDRASFHGLDLYSMYGSIQAVLRYLEHVDPEAAREGRYLYGCLDPWAGEPAAYGRLAVSGRYRSCEAPVLAMLQRLLARRMEVGEADGELRFEAERNAALVAAAERYYRTMYYGRAGSWNLRDTHMHETLQSLLAFRGAGTKAVVWAHNSHVGNAAFTEMGRRGELNIGRLCRDEYGDAAILIGFGTDHGTVAAASDWDAPMELQRVRPAMEGSYEALCHASGLPAFSLALRSPKRDELRAELEPDLLERAIGVIYRPQTERASHYFEASLPHQFDEYIWLDETSAVTPLPTLQTPGLPETWPFGL